MFGTRASVPSWQATRRPSRQSFFPSGWADLTVVLLSLRDAGRSHGTARYAPSDMSRVGRPFSCPERNSRSSFGAVTRSSSLSWGRSPPDGKGRADNDRRIVPLSAAVGGSSDGVLDWAAERNQEGFDVFVGANPVGRRQDAQGRMAYGATARHVQRFACAQLDLDKNTASAIGRLAQDVKAGLLPTPALVLRTSRGPNKYQMLWRLRSSDWGSPKDPQKASELFHVNRSLAHRYGGDPAACDVARLVRLAGFVNRKAIYQDRPVTVRSGLVTRLAGLPPAIEATPEHFRSVARLLPPPGSVAPPLRPRSSFRPGLGVVVLHGCSPWVGLAVRS